MTQPLKSSQSKTKQEPIVQIDIVQNKFENGIKCIQCQKVLSQDEFRDHIKLHVKADTMAKKTVDLVKNSKTIVKLETMNIPIKRKRHGSDGSSAKRIKIQDGETEISVDPTVDRVICKCCKPRRFFKTVDELRYHLVLTHNVSTTSSYYHDPTLSPAKGLFPTPTKSKNDVKKVRVKSQTVVTEIVDTPGLEDDCQVISMSTPSKPLHDNVQSPLGGKFSLDLMKIRRLNLKRAKAINCRTPKLQPVCNSEKRDVSIEDVSINGTSETVNDGNDLVHIIGNPSDNDDKTDPENRRKSRRISHVKNSEGFMGSFVDFVKSVEESSPSPSDSKPVNDHVIDDQSETPDEPSVRKRGRPRKYTDTASSVDSCKKSEEIATKRGRGRPRKSTSENVDIVDEDVSESSNDGQPVTEAKEEVEVVSVAVVPAKEESDDKTDDNEDVMLSQRKKNLRRSRRVSQTNDTEPSQEKSIAPIEKLGDTKNIIDPIEKLEDAKEVVETLNNDIKEPSEIPSDISEKLKSPKKEDKIIDLKNDSSKVVEKEAEIQSSILSNNVEKIESASSPAKKTPLKESKKKAKSKIKETKSKIKELPPERAPMRVSERRFKGAQLFKCNHCNLGFSTLENKKVHEATHIEKELLCHYCDMRFYFPLCLKRHTRIHES